MEVPKKPKNKENLLHVLKKHRNRDNYYTNSPPFADNVTAIWVGVKMCYYLLPSRFFPVCHIRCTKEEGSFFIVKAEFELVLGKRTGLVGLKTLGLVMACLLGFHFKELWHGGFVNYPLVGGSPPSCWAFKPWVGDMMLLGMTTLGHMA